jgi:ribonuclease PH
MIALYGTMDINFQEGLNSGQSASTLLERLALTKGAFMTRSFNRAANELRPVTLTAGVSRHAEGSCMVEFGHTKVLCTASVETGVPHFLRNTGSGWVTAEYGMLPRATNSRNPREAAKGKQSGRTQEIQRLIGRSLRTAIDLEKLGERQIVVDCDVIEADGGTRTASITGGFVALAHAIATLQKRGDLKTSPLLSPVAAISCGIVRGKPLLDLDYDEDSTAGVDANIIMTADGNMVELQMSGEESTFNESELVALLALGKAGIVSLVQKQREALEM